MPTSALTSALSGLREIARSLSTTVVLDTTLALIVRKTTEVMGVDSCSLYLLEADKVTLRLKASTGLRTKAVGYAFLPVGEGMTGLAVTENRPIYAPIATAHPAFKRVDYAKEERFSSLLAVPLRVGQTAIGSLNVQTIVAHDFSADEIDMLALIGELAAGAVAKAQLHATQQAQLSDLRALTQENARLATHASLVREMHHRIKNNLQTVTMLMQLQMPDADKLDTRDVLKSNIHRIRSIATVHEVLSEKSWQLVDVRDVLQRIAQATMQAVNAPQRTITIYVRGDSLRLPSQAATSLALVVNELVQNAVEHAFVGRTEGQILVSIGRKPTATFIWVRDNGCGMTPNTPHGLGLEIATTLIADDLAGTLEFIRLPQQGGTEVELRMPSVAR